MRIHPMSNNRRAQPVSRQQQHLVKLIVVKGLSVAEAGRRCGYSTRQAAHLAYRNLLKRVGKAMIDVGYPIDRLMTEKLIPLLSAKEIRFFQHQGVIMETREVEALGIQARVAIALMEAADAAARDEADRNSGDHRPGQVTVNMVVASADDAKEIMDFLARLSPDRERPLLDAALDENEG